MKENGQIPAGRGTAGVPVVPYRPTPGRPPGLEVLDLPGLAARAEERGMPLTAPGRPAFHLVIAVRGGRLECSVDFTAYGMGAGDWLWVWPGQVLQFPGGHQDAAATVLVFPTGFPSAATDALIRDGEHTPYRLITPDEPRQKALLRLLEALVEEHAALSDLSLEAYIETLRNLLSVILVRLAHLTDPRRQTRSGGGEPFHLFRRAVEEDFSRTHRVEDYAARLGYSPRTLTRATRAALGCGAKRYIDDRVLLEAKRLLIHTSLPPAVISERVGFTYPTVFSAFFRQRTGMTPTEFRSVAKP
ncbi:AraC family transcriptional regulator [Streptomyces sp. Tu 3180]|uniref:AraC family transcriptional regulator n=1 Tax=Streptomyces sp. Tu 3180 TaxID=2682611 RepID=UPI0013585E10|nr:AraC family transcriptional regulator [Streptomyces sp. Tu 3180]KAF3468757.1 AraC family transcriptional regulator [Streptomyces sp. Tu 3180]